MAAARDVPTVDLDDVRELAYLLYSIAEKKGWAETALLFNNLGTSWTDLEDASRRAGAGPVRGAGAFTLDFGSDDDGDETGTVSTEGLQLLGGGVAALCRCGDVGFAAPAGRDWVELLDARNNHGGGRLAVSPGTIRGSCSR